MLLDKQQNGPESSSSPDDYGTTRAGGAGEPRQRRDTLDDHVPF